MVLTEGSHIGLDSFCILFAVNTSVVALHLVSSCTKNVPLHFLSAERVEHKSVVIAGLKRA